MITLSLQGEDDILGKKEISKSIKIDEKTLDLALMVLGETDISFSELVRISLCVAAPTILSSPFIRKICVEDVDVSHFFGPQK